MSTDNVSEALLPVRTAFYLGKTQDCQKEATILINRRNPAWLSLPEVFLLRSV